MAYSYCENNLKKFEDDEFCETGFELSDYTPQEMIDGTKFCPSCGLGNDIPEGTFAYFLDNLNERIIALEIKVAKEAKPRV